MCRFFSSVVGIKPQTTFMEALKIAGNIWYMSCRRYYIPVLCMVLLLPLMTVRCSGTVLGSPYQGVGAAASCPQVTRLMCSVHQSLAPVSHLNIASSLHYTGSATIVPLSFILYQHPALPKGTSKCTANLYTTWLWCSKWEDSMEVEMRFPDTLVILVKAVFAQIITLFLCWNV